MAVLAGELEIFEIENKVKEFIKKERKLLADGCRHVSLDTTYIFEGDEANSMASVLVG